MPSKVLLALAFTMLPVLRSSCGQPSVTANRLDLASWLRVVLIGVSAASFASSTFSFGGRNGIFTCDRVSSPKLKVFTDVTTEKMITTGQRLA